MKAHFIFGLRRAIKFVEWLNAFNPPPHNILCVKCQLFNIKYRKNNLY